jgi:hypothetical protein
MRHYILIGREIAVEPDWHRWCQWFESSERLIAHTGNDKISVSTVFLGLDHNFSRRGPPLLFESMIFGGPHDGEQRRYATYDEAEAGHRELTALVFPALTPNGAGDAVSGRR